jgi:hypothetical protein
MKLKIILNTDIFITHYLVSHFLPQNFAVELQLENKNEFDIDHFREQLLRAGGANYGTGMRDP